MYGKYGLDSAVKISSCIGIMEINGHKSCLPVMAVDHIRSEAYKGQTVERCLLEKAELLYIPEPVSIGSITGEIVFIVNEIIGYALMLGLEHPDISVLSKVLHVEMSDILQLVLKLLLHTLILGYHHAAVKVCLVHVLGKRSGHISKSPRLDERHRFTCKHQNILHNTPLFP